MEKAEIKEEFSRTAQVIGKEGVRTLAGKHVAVFGIGGVGSYAAEALARAGVGRLTLVDHDTVSLSNINRQLLALHSTVGRKKTDVMRERILDINPDAEVHTDDRFFLPENAGTFPFDGVDFLVDAVDTVSAKIALAGISAQRHIPLISSMGTGNKLDPSRFAIADVFETSVCPLARVMRHELKKRGITHLTVLYSTEEPVRGAAENREENAEEKQVPGSMSFVPSAAGLMIAGYVVRTLVGTEKRSCAKSPKQAGNIVNIGN